MAIANIIAKGIGFSPGSTIFIPTHGFSISTAVVPDPDPNRTFTVAVEDRTFEVLAETRSFSVPAEDRTFEIPADSRTTVIH